MKLKNAHFLLYLKKKIFNYNNIYRSKLFFELIEKFIAIIDRIIMEIAELRPLRIKKSNSDWSKDEIEIYIGILVKDRPTELMNLYLSIQDSMLKLNEKVHIYIYDDNSTNLKTLEIIDSMLNNHPNILRKKRNKSQNSWNSAHNWAVKDLCEISKNSFDIIGTIDSDMILAKNWIEVIHESVVNLNLKFDLPVQYISIFNSDDRTFHRWKKIIELNGTKYVIKLRMGGATIFFLKKNLKLYSKSRYNKMGKHLSNFDDESRMTRRLLLQGLYCASTLESYAEHLPLNSILDSTRQRKRPPTKALNLEKENFSAKIRELLSKTD